MEQISKVKWFKTTGGKIGIVLGTIAAATGIILLVKHFKKGKEKESTNAGLPEKELSSTTTPSATTTSQNQNTSTTTTSATTAAELPNKGVGCGPIRSTFDRVYDYVKCGDTWYTISKDRIKIPIWKSLADNKTATDLLNNKYPS